MRIGDWPATDGLNDLYRLIRDLGLESNVAELDAYGLTVVAPEVVAPAGFADRLVEALFDVVERRTGTRPDLADGLTHPQMSGPFGLHLFWLLFDDPIFQEALMNPVSLALVTYLLGESCLLSSVNSILKGPGEAPNLLHHDTAHIPDPLPAYAQVANATWVLTDYTKENGALCFVPGSHRRSRAPRLDEADPLVNDEAVAVDAPAGSLVVWHGNTWHGAFPRSASGLRVNLVFYFCRSYLQTQEALRDNVPEDVLDRHDERFATLMGGLTYYGWTSEGPVGRLPRALAGKPLRHFMAGKTQHS